MKASAVVSAQPVFPGVAAGSSEQVLVEERVLVERVLAEEQVSVGELVLVERVLAEEQVSVGELVLVVRVLVAELVSVEEWASVEERAWSQGVCLDRA